MLLQPKKKLPEKKTEMDLDAELEEIEKDSPKKTDSIKKDATVPTSNNQQKLRKTNKIDDIEMMEDIVEKFTDLNVAENQKQRPTKKVEDTSELDDVAEKFNKIKNCTRNERQSKLKSGKIIQNYTIRKRR